VSVVVVLGEVEVLSAVGVVVLFDELSPLEVSPLLLSLVVVPELVLFPVELSAELLLLSPSPLPVLLEELPDSPHEAELEVEVESEPDADDDEEPDSELDLCPLPPDSDEDEDEDEAEESSDNEEELEEEEEEGQEQVPLPLFLLPFRFFKLFLLFLLRLAFRVGALTGSSLSTTSSLLSRS